MLTDLGLRTFLTALGKPFECRLWTQGTRMEEVYPCDPEYPKVNDTDKANVNRGEYVLTWRYTIPRGTTFRNGSADEAELLSSTGVIDRLKIPTLTPSADFPTVLYLNMILRRS